ncbi:CBS domain-containing protein [Actinotalea sp. M2MS4P-6]|uniref:CBS domain-containing protein n=1 Tax=Actinotalea sp. M2MS4P-6 TaxID=2983762 RepID=UPI0021E4BC91|nr:CBS domain-containing protein [Actinotalea sp. M2MS4P-6]MCV2395772.1 CBS domain-containing protein [Actinotalea sp. M2MS4P-6]
MRISDVLKLKGDRVATIDPTRLVRDLVVELGEQGVGALVVSIDGRSIHGIVSERDVVRRLRTDGAGVLDLPVSAIMTADVYTCEPSATVEELMEVMTERRFRHVPVVVDEHLAGIVSIGDVVKHRIAEVQLERDHLTAYITG